MLMILFWFSIIFKKYLLSCSCKCFSMSELLACDRSLLKFAICKATPYTVRKSSSDISFTYITFPLAQQPLPNALYAKYGLQDI
nr:MAG TPA: hypothetical protein [Caudoviricetes sp.]